jgi:hypothetical protein
MRQKVVFALIVLALAGCGGGDSSGTTGTTTTTPTGFSVAQYTSLNTGDTLTIPLTGTDTTGATYTGSIQTNIVGPVTYNGKNVIERDTLINLTETGVGVVLSSTSKSYYNSDRTLYEIVYSNAVTATPTSTFPLPTTVQIGTFGGQSLSYSNGNTLSSVWQVADAGSGNATVTVTSTTNLSDREVDTINVTAAGNISSIKEVIYNFPTAGVTTTLTGG